MFDFIKITTTPLVGIDISSSGIKMLELTCNNGQYRVETYGTALLAPQVIVERNIKQIDKVAESIRNLVKRSNVTSKFAAISVAGASALTRVIQLNIEYGDIQIADQIEAEAERYFPFALDQLYYDFERLGTYARNPELADILLAAARVEAVDSRVAAVSEAGLKPVIVDIETLAVERAFSLVVHHLGESSKAYTFALIDIGATNSILYVFKKLKVIYSREQNFGGKHLTDEIQRRYGLSLEEAVAAQRYGGLPDDYIEEVLIPFKDAVIQQINRSLQIFTSSGDEPQIDYIVLAGGVAKLHGLDTFVQNKLSIKTFVANPFLEAEVSSKVDKAVLFDEAPALMVACGLALRNFDNE